MDGVDLIATYKEFFYHGKWKRLYPGLSVLDKLLKKLFPEDNRTGVDAAINMIPDNYRVRVDDYLTDYYDNRERDEDRKRLVYYLSTILFGQYSRKEGELFEGRQVKERLHLLGIQTSIHWKNLQEEEIFDFVDEDGNPQDEEMRWSVVIPSLDILRLEHEVQPLFRSTIALKEGVDKQVVLAWLLDRIRRFELRSERLPYTIYTGQGLAPDIAFIFCEEHLNEEVMKVLDTRKRVLEMVTSLLVQQSFPKGPWGNRPDWLPWEYPWPYQWKEQDPFVPILGESIAYNAGAEKVYSDPEFSDSAISTDMLENQKEVIDYCRGILDARLKGLDDKEKQIIFPTPRTKDPRKALWYLFLLNTLDTSKHRTARDAYQDARRDLDLNITITASDYGSIYTKIWLFLDNLRPSTKTMDWARKHVKKILQIFFDMNNEAAEDYAGRIKEKKKWSFNLLQDVITEQDPGDVEKAIAIALREYGPETHIIQYERLLPEAKRIAREIYDSSPESSLEESLEELPDLGYDQLRFRIVKEVENRFGGETRVDDRPLNKKDESYIDIVIQEVKQKLWELSFEPENTWGHELMNFRSAWGMRLNFLLGIIREIVDHRPEDWQTNDEEVGSPPPRFEGKIGFVWEFFRP